jgi:hypothetical protein
VSNTIFCLGAVRSEPSELIGLNRFYCFSAPILCGKHSAAHHAPSQWSEVHHDGTNLQKIINLTK